MATNLSPRWDFWIVAAPVIRMGIVQGDVLRGLLDTELCRRFPGGA